MRGCGSARILVWWARASGCYPHTPILSYPHTSTIGDMTWVGLQKFFVIWMSIRSHWPWPWKSTNLRKTFRWKSGSCSPTKCGVHPVQFLPIFQRLGSLLVEKVMYVVYAIESLLTGRVYLGQSQDFEERLKLHNGGHVRSTSKDLPWVLLAMERFETRDQARRCETLLKRSRGRRLKWLQQHKV